MWLSRLSASRSRLPRLAQLSLRRGLSADAANRLQAKKPSVWPWLVGLGLAGASGYYLLAGPKAKDESDPLKAATDIINVFHIL